MNRLIAAWLRLVRREPPSPAALRNRVGGMAWVRFPAGDFACCLNGHVVRTVKVDAQGYWTTDPLQLLHITRVTVDVGGLLVHPGQTVGVLIPDCSLIPIPDAGVSDAEVRALYAPKLQEAA